MAPNLTFYCELEPAPLQALFDSPRLFDQLIRLNASVSLGIMDLSPERAAVIQALNQAGIPVHAWLLLPKDQGYWFNLGNARQAVERYRAVSEWSQANNLNFTTIGLDIEPDIRAMQKLAKNKWKGIRSALSNMRSLKETRRAAEIYTGLVEEIHADALHVDSYQFPLIVDERAAGSRLVQRLAGVLDLPVDREVLMLYSSFYPSIGTGILYSYGRDAGGIGLGSTGGGVTMEGLANTASLDWPAFRRDLLLAEKMCSHLYIFSLEGCAQQDFLEKMLELDWNETVELPRSQIRKVAAARRLGELFLRVSKLFV